MSAPAPCPNGYVLLLSSDESYKQLSLEQLQEVVRQNKAWIERLVAQGKVKGGLALARSGAVVSGRGASVVSDGPFIESKEALGGTLLLDVATLDEAIAIARTSPSLAFCASIEVRPVRDECPLDAWLRELSSRQPTPAIA